MSEKRHFEFRYSGTTAERTVFTPTAVPMYWWDTDLTVLFVWDGTAWRRLGGVNWDNVIIVDPGGNGDYTTITAAEAAASDDDLILVVPGTYAEALDAGSTAVTIAAITPGTVTLDASGQADYAVNLSGTKDVHLYGMTITPAASHACIYAAGGAYSGTVTLTRVTVGDPGGPASILMSSGSISLDIVTVEGEVGFYGTASGGGLGNVFEERVFLAATASYSSKNDVFEGDIDANAGATMTWQGGSICLGAIDSDVTITYDSPVVEAGDVGIGAIPGTQLEQAGTAPYHTFWNTTEEDSDGGRESRLIFEGEQSGGEHTTLAWIEAAHDGAADDEQGKLTFYTNDGGDGDAPTERGHFDADGKLIVVDDVHVLGDEAGIGQRRDLYTDPVTDHFDYGTLDAAWSWAGAPFTTPPTVDLTGDSLLRVGNFANAADRAFLYRSVSGTPSIIRAGGIGLTTSTTSFGAGVRMDDGTDNNYFEVQLTQTAFTPGTYVIRFRHRAGGGAVTVVDGPNLYIPLPYVARAGIGGTKWTNWNIYPMLEVMWSVGGFAYEAAAAAGLAWTPTREGLVFMQGGVATASWHRMVVDFYKTS